MAGNYENGNISPRPATTGACRSTTRSRSCSGSTPPGGNSSVKRSFGRASACFDLGCGTGTLVVQLKLDHPNVEIVGIDPDPKALARARRKAERVGVTVQFDVGFGDALPYPPASFDQVLSSFVLHHLETEEKEPTLREIRRVLKVEGTLHLLDFGGDESPRRGLVTGWLHGTHRLRDSFGGAIQHLLRQAGFAEVHRIGQGAILFGHLPIAYYRATMVS